LLLAEGSDQPRAYEVVGQLIKTISDVSKDLVDLQKKVKEIRGDDHSSNNPTVVNNAVFIGSTADLQAIINGRPNIIDGESSDV
jgi:ABC-type hemin transport system substrate-binding protein